MTLGGFTKTVSMKVVIVVTPVMGSRTGAACTVSSLRMSRELETLTGADVTDCAVATTHVAKFILF